MNEAMPYLGSGDERTREMMERFGAELRRCRHLGGLSQATLAHRAGVPQSTISRLERGRAVRVPAFKVVLLAQVLGRRFPLAYCPHEHFCEWQRLDSLGRPVETSELSRTDWLYLGR